jgi:hypothetical protein
MARALLPCDAFNHGRERATALLLEASMGARVVPRSIQRSGLVGCYLDNTTESSASPPRTFVPREADALPELEPYAERVARLPLEWSEEEKVEGLLSSYCGECHGPCRVPAAVCDGTTWIDDIDRLVQEAKIVPGSPDESQVIQMMVDGSMPPDIYPDAPPELIERISAFIVSLCAGDARASCQAGADAGD